MEVYEKIKLSEVNFFSKYDEINFIPIMGLMVKKILEKRNMKMKVKHNPQSFYNQLNIGINPQIGIGFKCEPIKSYNQISRHFDDGDIYEDIKYKSSLKELVKLLYSNKTLSELDISSKSAIIHLFNEIDRNVRNHSGIADVDEKSYHYAVIVYPKKRKLQFVIADEGQGFEGSLKTSQAVELSVGKGVTAKSNHSEVESSGQNSGYGLYLAHRLSRGEHDLEIIDNSKYYIASEESMILKHNLVFDKEVSNFTIVAITIDIDYIATDMQTIDFETESKSAKSSLILLDEQQLLLAKEFSKSGWNIFNKK